MRVLDDLHFLNSPPGTIFTSIRGRALSSEFNH